MSRQLIVERGEALYQDSIRQRVEGTHDDKFVAIDVLTGEFEVDENILTACDRLRLRQPTAVPYVVRVGHPAAVKIGARPRMGAS